MARVYKINTVCEKKRPMSSLENWFINRNHCTCDVYNSLAILQIVSQISDMKLLMMKVGDKFLDVGESTKILVTNI